MATHSSVLAWSILGMGSLVGYCLWGRTESDTTEATEQQQNIPRHPVFPDDHVRRLHSVLSLFSPATGR